MNHLLLIHRHWALQKYWADHGALLLKASGGSSSMKESKNRHYASPQGEKVNPAAHCIMGSVAKENTRPCSCEGNSTFTQRERTGGKICSGGVGGSLQLSRPAAAPAAMQGNWPTLAQQSKDSDPIPVEPEILRLKTFSTGLSRTKKHLLSLKQEKRIPHKVTSPAQTVWLFLSQ